LYQGAPPRTGKPGRPRKKGKRLDNPTEMATKLRDDQFAAVRVDLRGTERDLLVWSRPVLWYTTDPDHLVLLVIVRDPQGVMRDDFFFTTDLAASPGDVASLYAGRWSIVMWLARCLMGLDVSSWSRSYVPRVSHRRDRSRGVCRRRIPFDQPGRMMSPVTCAGPDSAEGCLRPVHMRSRRVRA
ncbi:MAG: hypothetical protein M0Z42_11730, partial [Actinomycetota bacterium]|nr:hypothetical protein [Actinomycetota bacterium]